MKRTPTQQLCALAALGVHKPCGCAACARYDTYIRLFEGCMCQGRNEVQA